MAYKPNFGDTRFTYEPMPTGTFATIIEEATVAPNRKGNSTLTCKGKATSHGEEGHAVQYDIVLTVKAAWRLANLLLATGKYTEQELRDPNFVFNEGELVGIAVGIVVEPNKFTNSNGDIIRTTQIKRNLPVSQCVGRIEMRDDSLVSSTATASDVEELPL